MIKKLIKIRLAGLLTAVAAGRTKNGAQNKISKGKLVLFAFLYLYLGAVLVGLASMMAYSLGAALIPLGFDTLYFGLFILVSFTMVFILSIFETKATLFECKDNELLLSMPIAVRDIVVSRIFTVLIYNYIECALIMAPVTVIYALLGGAPLMIFGAVTVSLLVPLFATALSSGVGYLVALISRRLKKKTFLTVIISLVFLCAYFVGYQYLLEGLDSLAEISPEVAITLADNLGFVGIIGLTAAFNPIALLVLTALTALTSLTAYYFISKHYIKIITASAGTSRAVYKAERLKEGSPFSALVKKELRAFFSSANYILNGGIGALFGILMPVMLLINRADIILLIDELVLIFPELSADIDGIVAVLASSALFAFSSMTTISAPALSLEGKKLWVLKSLPIKAEQILFAKTMPHIIVSAPIALISSVITIFALEISPVWWTFVILIPLVGSALSAFFGAVIGAALPKFDYVSDIQVIKQSMAVGVTMLSSMLIGVGTVVGSFLLVGVMPPVFAGLAVLFAMLLVTAALVLLLLTVLAKKLERI